MRGRVNKQKSFLSSQLLPYAGVINVSYEKISSREIKVLATCKE